LQYTVDFRLPQDDEKFLQGCLLMTRVGEQIYRG
jgi:hypothetical protein